jgi:hypothetical protein
MDSGIVVAGKRFTPKIIARAKRLLEKGAPLVTVAREVCELLDWRSAKGLQEASCMVALRRLAHRGILPAIPHSRQTVPRQMRMPEEPVPPPTQMPKTLKGVKALKLVVVPDQYSDLSLIWNGLIGSQHPQKRQLVMGRQIRYLIASDHGWLGAASFSSPSWRLRDRDQWLGWSDVVREENLQKIICMSRFLIRREVNCKNLASKVLSLLCARVVDDWQQRYGESPVLAETFVDTQLFQGSCYKAAGWQRLGQTKGRGRQDTHNLNPVDPKDIYVFPLVPGYRVALTSSEQGEQAPPFPPMSIEEACSRVWHENEFARSPLNDQRLNVRAGLLAAGRFANPTGGFTGLPGNKHVAKAAYRFLESSEAAVTMQNLLYGHRQESMRRIAGEKIILYTQDTTRVNYDGLKKTTGLGPISGNQTGHQAQGLILHDTQAFTPEGLPLGCIDALCWSRREQDEHTAGEGYLDATDERQPFVKESDRWILSYLLTDEIAHQLPDRIHVNISDREGDIYDLFQTAVAPSRKAYLLVRATHDRKVEGKKGKECLWPHVRRKRSAGIKEVLVGRSAGRPSRTATCQIRYGSVKLKPPAKKSDKPSLPLNAVYVKEIKAPKGVEPIEWMLLTTCPVDSFETACELVDWYSRRWKIEEIHRILKSGCKIEQRQLKTALALKRALAIDLVVAWRILFLTMLSRQQPDLPASIGFNEIECKVLDLIDTDNPKPTKKKRRGKTSAPLTIAEAVRAVALLGGFMDRPSDGPPGAQTLWRGLVGLNHACQVLSLYINNATKGSEPPPPRPP